MSANEKHKELFQICWIALNDQTMICKDCDIGNKQSATDIINTRIYLFLKDLPRRLQNKGICKHGSYNATYEAMQCLHPDAKKIIDLASIPDLIMLIVQETLLEYLKSFSKLDDQLAIIKKWLIRVSECQSIFSGDDSADESKILDIIRNKFRAKGYGEISDQAFQNLKKQFYATPLFLREFENLESQFANDGLDIYQTISKVVTLEEHVKYYKRKYLARKFNWLSLTLADSFEPLIEELMHEKNVCDNEYMNKATFMLIVERLKRDGKKLTAFLRETKRNIKDSTEVRLIATLYLFIEVIENEKNPDEIINELSHIGNAEEVMWLLSYFYSRIFNISQRKSLQKLILLLHKQGVKVDKCVRNNISAAQLLISTKLMPANIILHILPNKTFINYEDDNVLQSRAVLLMSCGLSMIIVGLPIAFTLASNPLLAVIIVCLALIAPVMFRNEILGYIKSRHIRGRETEEISTTLFNLPKIQKGKFKEFFMTAHNKAHLTKLLSPLSNVAKIFNETALPYVIKFYDKLHLINDLAQPLDGVKHILIGLFKILNAPRFLFKRQWSVADISFQAVSGVADITRGISEILLTPYTYCIKIPCRFFQTQNKKSALQGDMMVMATELQDKIQNKISTRLNSKSPLIPDQSNAKNKICDALFNKTAELHQRYKFFKKTMPVIGSQFKIDEKEGWRNVKSTFFVHFVDKRSCLNQDDVNVINKYCSLYTHR